jgi:hypothetical protein
MSTNDKRPPAFRRVRRVEIFVHGPTNERREALRIVREGLEWVHSLFEEIGPKPMVPVRIPNKPDAAIEYFRLIDFEREGLEKYAFEGHQFHVRELLNGIAPVAPIQKTEDRRSDLHIYASDRANVQVINGNDNKRAAATIEPLRGYHIRLSHSPSRSGKSSSRRLQCSYCSRRVRRLRPAASLCPIGR